MTKDKELEALFASAITEFDDNDIFIDKLSSRLDKVEFLKRIQQEQKRSCRRYLVVAFVAGVLSAVVALLLLPMLPTDLEIIRSITSIGNVALFSYKVKVLSSLMILGLTYGLVFSVYSVLAETRKL